jgi:hypothetical protein
MIMAEKIENAVKKRLKEGWIKSWVMIEALAVSEDTAKSAIEKLVEKMEGEKNVMVFDKDLKGIKKVEDVNPKIPQAFSQVIEFHMLTPNYDKLVYMIMNYGPSAVEILEPKEIRMDQGEAQGILNSISTMIHRFAAARGGMWAPAQ